jgi:NADH-quinone oxidoreductase subunit E
VTDNYDGIMALRLSDKAEAKLEELKRRYPQERSAIMPALYLAQEELGSITAEAIAWVSERLALAPVQVLEVASFYTMYYKKPVGRYHFQVCRTVSCALRGQKLIVEHLKQRFKLKSGEVSPDGLWSFEEVECLGSCGSGPVCEINDHYFENLSVEKLEKIIRRIEAEKPDLRLSAVEERLGQGLKDYPKSEVGS